MSPSVQKMTPSPGRRVVSKEVKKTVNKATKGKKGGGKKTGGAKAEKSVRKAAKKLT